MQVVEGVCEVAAHHEAVGEHPEEEAEVDSAVTVEVGVDRGEGSEVIVDSAEGVGRGAEQVVDGAVSHQGVVGDTRLFFLLSCTIPSFEF